MARRLHLVALLVALTILTGCASLDEPSVDLPSRSGAQSSGPDSADCGHWISFEEPGLYDALVEATTGEFEHRQPAPTLPYENASLRERWRDYSLLSIRHEYGEVADFPTGFTLRPYDDVFMISASAEANVSADEIRAHFTNFTTQVLVADEEQVEAWAQDFLRSKSPSAWRDGIPGNATPGGEGPFREYQEGPIYGYSYEVEVNATPRLEDLIENLPPLDQWTQIPSETGRMLYEHDNWTLWFQQPFNILQVGDVRVTAWPTGEANAVVSVAGQNATEALRTALVAFNRAGLEHPPIEAHGMQPLACGD